MIQVNIHEAKTQLSKLVARAAEGEAFIIARAGKPLVKVVPYDVPEKPRLLGCMRGLGTIDEKYLDVREFKALARDEIMAMFYGEGEEDGEDGE